MKQTGLTPYEILYWGIFILIAISATQLLLSLTTLASQESTLFSTTAAYERVSQKRDEATIQTSLGDFRIKLLKRVAPVTVNNFVAFAESDLYVGTKFHRVAKDLLIQGGDPLSRGDKKSLYGTGGPGFVFDDEIVGLPMEYGTVAMANRGAPDTNGSQFFIVTSKEGVKDLEGKYTIFGRVESGMDVVEAINVTEVDDELPVEPVVVKRVIVN